MVKLRFWRFVAYWLIISLLGTDPRLDFWTLHAQSCALPSNSSTDSVRLTYFAYDFDGHLTQVNSPEGVINYGYDLATGQLTSTCTANSLTQYTYDELRRLKTVTALKRNGVAINETTTYTYDKVGNRSTVALPNGVVTYYAYDTLNRLTNLTHQAGTTNLATYTYALDLTGRRTNAVEVLRQEDGSYLTITQRWAFDQMYRLTNEVSLCSSASYSYTNSYRYDQVGNRFSKTRVQSTGTITTTNLFNANDQLLQEVSWSGSTMTESNGYAYDSNGSLLAKTNTSSSSATALYGYDLKNKLSNVTAAGSSVTNFFLYNDSGIRVQSLSSSGSDTTLYLVDANNRTGYAQVLEELIARGASPKMSYVIGDDVLAQGAETAEKPSYFLHDGHGSTRQLSKWNGTISSHYNYDAYGIVQEAISSSTAEAAPTTKLYCGEQYDATLQMYNLRARFYDPRNGRFHARDTFEGNNEDPLSLHKYDYCECNPVVATDPSGHDGELISLLINIAIRAANLARSLGPTFIAKNVAQKFVNRVLTGALLGSVTLIYKEHYLPPLIRELQSLASSLDPVSHTVAQSIDRLAAKVADLNKRIEEGALLRPIFTAQLGPIINLTHLGMQLTELHYSIIEAEQMVGEAAALLGVDLKFTIDEIQFVKDLAFWNLDPAGDVATFRGAVESYKAGQPLDALNRIRELMGRYLKYSSFTVTLKAP